jgi:hypothetical protein
MAVWRRRSRLDETTRPAPHRLRRPHPWRTAQSTPPLFVDGQQREKGTRDRVARRHALAKGTRDRAARRHALAKGTRDRAARRHALAKGTRDRVARRRALPSLQTCIRNEQDGGGFVPSERCSYTFVGWSWTFAPVTRNPCEGTPRAYPVVGCHAPRRGRLRTTTRVTMDPGQAII